MISARFAGQTNRSIHPSPGGTTTEQTASALPPVVDRQTWQAALDELRVRPLGRAAILEELHDAYVSVLAGSAFSVRNGQSGRS